MLLLWEFTLDRLLVRTCTKKGADSGLCKTTEKSTDSATDAVAKTLLLTGLLALGAITLPPFGTFVVATSSRFSVVVRDLD